MHCGSDHCFAEWKIYVYYKWWKQIKNMSRDNNKFDLLITKYNLKTLEHDSAKYLYEKSMEEKFISERNVEKQTTEEQYQCMKRV